MQSLLRNLTNSIHLKPNKLRNVLCRNTRASTESFRGWCERGVSLVVTMGCTVRKLALKTLGSSVQGRCAALGPTEVCTAKTGAWRLCGT